MIAYNKEWLDNSYLHQEIENAFTQKLITKKECDTALTQYPVGFYTPNFFIRVGLVVLTLVIISFSFGFFSLLFLSGNEYSMGFLSIFCGCISYAALEYMVKNKNHFASGVDDALLWMSGSLLVGGINILSNLSTLSNAILILLIASYFMVRFSDKLMAFIAAIALLAVVFFTVSKLGDTAKALTPFGLMLIAAVLYFVSKLLIKNKKFKYYHHCFTIIEITALLCFYIAGNYFVVRELSNSMFNLQLQPTDSIPFTWLFWLFTCSIPFVYICSGIYKKDAILLRVGVFLIAAVVFTIRFYHQVLSIESAMIIGGVFMIMISYWLIHLLKVSRRGFTSQIIFNKNKAGIENIEAIVIAETMQQGQHQNTDTQFGGGSFGGGGSTGDF